MKDGWHGIRGYSAYVENGVVALCTRRDSNGAEVTAYPYKHSRNGGWDKAVGVTLQTLTRGLRNGNYIIR